MKQFEIYRNEVKRLDGNDPNVELKYEYNIYKMLQKGANDYDVRLTTPHPLTHTNFPLLVSQLLKSYSSGDEIVSPELRQIRNYGSQVEIQTPLSRDELKYIGAAVLRALKNK